MYLVARQDGSDFEPIAVVDTVGMVYTVIANEIHKWGDSDEWDAAFADAREALTGFEESGEAYWESRVGSWDFDVRTVRHVQ